jgi:predicted N-formylglutamate amidohydrolase
MPEKLNNLGLEAPDLNRHIAYDPGTRDMGEYLSRKLDCPAIFGRFSRAVIDLNRYPTHPTAMPVMADGTPIPGNKEMEEFERQQRIDEIFLPYHRKARDMIQAKRDAGQIPLILLVHSFTPVFRGVERPWEISVLWHKADERVARPFLDILNRDYPNLTIGDNEPYSCEHGWTFNSITPIEHGEQHGLPMLLLETRNDLIKSQPGVQKWSDIILHALTEVAEDDSVFTINEEMIENYHQHRKTDILK